MAIRWIVYGLIDPRNHMIKYVGVTKQSLNQRLGGHMADVAWAYDRAATKTRSKKQLWMRELKELDLRPLIVMLESVHCCVVGAGEAEKRWIETLRRNGAPLTNSTPGGRPCVKYKGKRQIWGIGEPEAIELGACPNCKVVQ